MAPPTGLVNAAPRAADLQVRRDRQVVVGATLVSIAALWLWLARTHLPGAAGSHHGHGASTAYPYAFAFWAGMMAAMMLPAVLPWIALFATVHRGGPAARSPRAGTAVFATGYLTVWTLYSAAAALAQVVLHDRLWLSGADLRLSGTAGAVVLVVAGLFQVSPIKQGCLRHCRNPLTYLIAHQDDGPFRLGLRHGGWCLACCWGLMLLAFALGVMNLAWMAALTLLLCVEKIAPGGAWVGRAVGWALIGWGAWLMIGTPG